MKERMNDRIKDSLVAMFSPQVGGEVSSDFFQEQKGQALRVAPVGQRQIADPALDQVTAVFSSISIGIST